MTRRFALLSALLVASCSSTQEGIVVPDATPPPPDAPLPIDARLPDAPGPDARPPDAAPPDARPDANLPDGCIPGPELCNLADDNCNGLEDETFTDLGDPCVAGVGICAKSGLKMCTADGMGTKCSATPGPAGTELCANGLDDDCDGTADEGFEMLGSPCSVGIGACKATGAWICSPDKKSLVCSATPGTPAPSELCGNSVDDNCNGATDEGFELFGSSCSNGVGACKATGAWVCSSDKKSLICNAQPGMPAPAELCGNKIDDNCNGFTDEGFETVGQNCDGPDNDFCKEGKIVCTSNLLGVECNDNTGNNIEICNGDDDDCNPATIDGSQDPQIVVFTPCTAGEDICLEGKIYCSAQGLKLCDDPADDTIDNDPQNCGSCGHNCTNAHGGIACTNKACNPSCFQGYQSCDADLDDGCELSRWSDATCGVGTTWEGANWGTINGDTSGTVIKTGLEETWAHILVHEDSDSIDDLQVKLTITNPSGARFGLRARCYSCGSTGYRTAEPDEQGSASFYFGAGDEWPNTTDDFDLAIEVYFISNSSRTCNPVDDHWTVRIDQTEDTSLRDCEANFHD